MGITAAQVNELRKKTGAGMMDCKKALNESNGDMNAAIDYLRKKGQKISAKRADREATEGAIIAKVNNSGNFGVVLRLNCETDFVAKNEEFVAFAHQLAQLALDNDCKTIEEINLLSIGDKNVSETIVEMVGTIGEKIEIGEYYSLTGEGIVDYIHAGNKIGVLVVMNQKLNEIKTIAGKDVAMQIAAMNPVSVDESSVPEDVKKRELEIGKEQARQEGKPEAMIEKIALGKLNKFYKEQTLLKQVFVKDSSKTIDKFLKEIDGELTVLAFKRVSLN